ncbi:hypothetical protein MMC27_004816 [Xylographa pallens]|nr:hypothetical protein [Xylographa pallens]
MTAVEHPENENGASHEDDPRAPKTILKQIHTKIHSHSRQSSQDDNHRDPEDSGAVMKLVRRACRKLHLGRECSVDENGTCRFDQLQALRALLNKDTTDPISDAESRMIRECVAKLTDDEARLVEGWCQASRERPPGYTERAGDEAEASGSTVGPSRRVGVGSQDTDVAEHGQQSEVIEASGSTSRPSGRSGSNSQDTNVAEHAAHAEHGEGEASRSASRPSRRVGPGSHATHVAEYLENVEVGRGEGEAHGSAPRPSGQVGCVAVHVEYVPERGDKAKPSRRTPGPPHSSTSASRATNTDAHPSQGGDQAEGSGLALRPLRRATFGSHDGEGDEEGDRSGRTLSIARLMKRVRSRLHIS